MGIFKNYISVNYYNQCLINPPVFPGTLGVAQYLAEISYQHVAGTRSEEELSEIVGETLGSLAVGKVIALCINTYVNENSNPGEIRALDQKFDEFIRKYDMLSKSYPYQLDMKKVALGAGRNLEYLLSAGKVDVRMQSEMRVSSDYCHLRYLAVREFSPVQLRELLYEEIENLTGLKPKK
jgi:hypothetical protein